MAESISRRALLHTTLLAGAGVTLGACGQAAATPAAPAKPAAAPAPPTAAPTAAPAVARVTTGWAPTSAIAPLYFAIERGYFAEQAIEPELIAVSNSSQMVASLGTDEMNLSFGAISAGLLNALGRGIAVKVIAPVGSQPSAGPGANQLLVRKALWDGGEVAGVRDLEGRRVAIVGRGSLIEYLLHKLLQRHGMALRDVDVTELSFPNMIAGLANGSVDAALATEPFVTGAVSRGVGVPLPDPADANITPGQATTYILASERFSEAQRAVAVRFLSAVARAMRDVEGGRAKAPENLAIIAKYTSIEPSVLASNVLTEWNPSLRIDAGFIADQQAFFLETGQLERPVDLDRLIDSSIAAEAVRRA